MVALFSLLAGAALFTGMVSAQNPPQCALTCATNAAANSTCGSLTNLKCLCNDQAFFDAAGACTVESCPPDQVEAAEAALQSICKGYATTTFSLDTSTLSYTGSGSPSGSSNPASTTSGTSPTTSPTTSSGTGSRQTHTGSSTTTPPSSSSPTTTTPASSSTSSRGAAGKRAEILAGVGPTGVMIALGVVAGAFALAF